jgi:hypothetical protein
MMTMWRLGAVRVGLIRLPCVSRTHWLIGLGRTLHRSPRAHVSTVDHDQQGSVNRPTGPAPRPLYVRNHRYTMPYGGTP